MRGQPDRKVPVGARRGAVERRGNPSRAVVLSLATAGFFVIAFYAWTFAHWQPPYVQTLQILNAIYGAIFVACMVITWRGRTLVPAIVMLAVAAVALMPFTAVFSAASDIQMLYVAVGFAALAALPERLVGLRIAFSAAIVLAILWCEWRWPAGSGAVPLDDPNLAVLANATRLCSVGVVALSISILLVRTTRSSRELRRLAAQGERRANTDFLTGIPNRRPVMHLLRDLDDERARGYAIVIIDIDRFKAINDTWGHDTGDAVIQEVADRLGAALGDYATVARWGGDEFLAVVEGLEASPLQRMLDDMRRAMSRRPVAVGDAEVPVTLSIGYAMRPEGASSHTVLAAADSALYAAKNGGRDCVCAA